MPPAPRARNAASALLGAVRELALDLARFALEQMGDFRRALFTHAAGDGGDRNGGESDPALVAQRLPDRAHAGESRHLAHGVAQLLRALHLAEERAAVQPVLGQARR